MDWWFPWARATRVAWPWPAESGSWPWHPSVSTGLILCVTPGTSTLRHYREHGHGNPLPPARDRIMSIRRGGEPLPRPPRPSAHHHSALPFMARHRAGLRLPELLHVPPGREPVARKHRRSSWKDLRCHYCDAGWWPASEERRLFNLAKVATTRHRYQGSAMPAPWPSPCPVARGKDSTCMSNFG